MRRWRVTLAETIEGYLAQLRGALAGADPALVQDALYDAEEYLRSAAAEDGTTPESIATAIDAYGTPEEIADAYREREITVAEALRKPAPQRRSTILGRFFGVLADPGAWGALFYMLLALVTGIMYFTVVVTGLSLTFGLSVLIVGIPLALLFIAIVRAVSLAEGRMVEGLLGLRMPRRPRTVGQTGNLWERIKSWFTDYRTWTTMLYMVLQLMFGIIYFTVVVTGLSLALSFIALPFAQWIFDLPLFVFGDYHYQMNWWAAPFVILIGVLTFVATMWVAKGVGVLHGAYAKVMLVGRFDSDAAAGVAGQEVQS
ncbi:MAG: sensor domain-containing protein [Coriobacteriia bacterium]|nr:sensor domain-containing protein [Coriobacteriia bacterium]